MCFFFFLSVSVQTTEWISPPRAVSAKRVPPVSSVSGCDSNWLRRHSGQYLIRLMWPLVRRGGKKKTCWRKHIAQVVSHCPRQPFNCNATTFEPPRENVSIIWLWVMDTSSELFLRACIIVYSFSRRTLVCVVPSGVARQKAAPRTWLLNDDIHLHSCNPSISPSCIQFEPVDWVSDPISTGKYSSRLKI